MIRRLRTLRPQFGRALLNDVSANVLMLTAGSMMMLTLAIGFGVDYARAVQARTRLNTAADAAALVSVDPAMFNQSDAVAAAAARAMFMAKVSGLSDITLTSLTVSAPSVTSSVASTSRTATVTWTATVRTTFSSVLGQSSMTITGQAVANAAQPPNINFHVMLDNSPSMLLPTTSAGIAALSTVNNNCAFSCHINSIVYNPMKDSAGNIIILDNTFYANGINQDAGVYRYNATTRQVRDAANTVIGSLGTVNGSYTTLSYKSAATGATVNVNTYPADPFWLAENYGKAYGSPASIRMRIDDELAAAQDLIATAQTTAAQLSSASTNVEYKMQFYTMNYETHALTSSLENVNDITPAELVPSGGTIAPFMLQNGYYPNNSNPSAAPGVDTNNSDSSPYAALGQINGVLPNPGSGTPSSTPQEVLIIVTDGYQDEMIGGSQIRQAWNTATQNQCTAIKNRGIRIAILYTVYDPNTILPHYPSYASKTPSIAPALQQCSSSTSGGGHLMYTVSANQDISAALAQLFAMTVQTAHLTQ